MMMSFPWRKFEDRLRRRSCENKSNNDNHSSEQWQRLTTKYQDLEGRHRTVSSSEPSKGLKPSTMLFWETKMSPVNLDSEFLVLATIPKDHKF